jgi:hypothetical protein
MRIKLMNLLEEVFGCIAQWAERMRERCAVCTACGRNRYTSPPCIGRQ